jgi:hypothetical protein
MEYKDLKTYCARKKWTFKEFGEMVDPKGELRWKTYYKVISGFINAGKKSGRNLDAFIEKNRADIRRTLKKCSSARNNHETA